MLFIISWLLCGILSAFIVVVYDLRGEKYNANYFDDIFFIFLIMCLGGYVSVIVITPILIMIRCEKHKTSVKK